MYMALLYMYEWPPSDRSCHVEVVYLRITQNTYTYHMCVHASVMNTSNYIMYMQGCIQRRGCTAYMHALQKLKSHTESGINLQHIVSMIHNSVDSTTHSPCMSNSVKFLWKPSEQANMLISFVLPQPVPSHFVLCEHIRSYMKGALWDLLSPWTMPLPAFS